MVLPAAILVVISNKVWASSAEVIPLTPVSANDFNPRYFAFLQILLFHQTLHINHGLPGAMEVEYVEIAIMRATRLYISKLRYMFIAF